MKTFIRQLDDATNQGCIVILEASELSDDDCRGARLLLIIRSTNRNCKTIVVAPDAHWS